MVRSIRIVSLLGVFLFGVFLLVFGSEPAKADEKGPKKKNILIIGRSSLMSPPRQDELVGALLESHKTPMNVEPGFFGTQDLERRWSSGKVWDYVIIDAWQLTRGATDAPGFPDAVASFVKHVRAHSPQCQIILFPWWIPSGPEATNEGVLKVFQRCVEAARENDIWVATTGPAFMEARLENLRAAGCPWVLLDSSFISHKPNPADVDGCWHYVPEIDESILEEAFWLEDWVLDRRNLILRYGMDFFIADALETGSGKPFAEFFLTDKNGDPKGIVRLDLDRL